MKPFFIAMCAVTISRTAALVPARPAPLRPDVAARPAADVAARRRVLALRSEPGVVSPFASGERGAGAAGAAAGGDEFTVGAVDATLDEVRPYLVADGGDVAVVSVDAATKDVILKLQGACGSCPSSTTTMKMGIERVLRERWPDLGVVSRDDDPENMTLEAAVVEKILEPIAGAVAMLGATVSVLTAGEAGPKVVELAYAGPENVKYGIELSLLDSPLIDAVVWKEPEPKAEDAPDWL